MAADPRKLRPSELCRLLNSTPLGEVANERQMYRLRTRFGLQVGDARHVDLLRLTAKLVEVRHAPKAEPDGDPYEKLKDRARARNVALAGMPGASNSNWYLLADPNNLPAFQVAYLRGQRQPTIETADAQFNTLGIQLRCYFDFGVARIDHRGALKASA